MKALRQRPMKTKFFFLKSELVFLDISRRQVIQLECQISVLKKINESSESKLAERSEAFEALSRTNDFLMRNKHSLSTENALLEKGIQLAYEELGRNKTKELSVTGNFVYDFENLVERTLKHPGFMPPRTHARTKCKTIASVVWSLLVGVRFREYTLVHCRDAMLDRNPMLNPVEVAHMMDEGGAVGVNFKGVDQLRTLEWSVDGGGQEKGSDWMTSTYKIKDAMYHLEKKAEDNIIIFLAVFTATKLLVDFDFVISRVPRGRIILVDVTP